VRAAVDTVKTVAKLGAAVGTYKQPTFLNYLGTLLGQSMSPLEALPSTLRQPSFRRRRSLEM